MYMIPLPLLVMLSRDSLDHCLSFPIMASGGRLAEQWPVWPGQSTGLCSLLSRSLAVWQSLDLLLISIIDCWFVDFSVTTCVTWVPAYYGVFPEHGRLLYVASVLTLIGLESGRPLALFPYFTNELIFSKSSLFSASILSPTLLAEFCI